MGHGPSCISRMVTSAAISIPIAKHRPCAWPIMAVLMPTTLPVPSTKAPPELPGLSGASVWMTLWISRPLGERKVRRGR